jgi:hypothetical protein
MSATARHLPRAPRARERDQFLTEEPFCRARQRCAGPFRYERLDTGHWMPTERPDQVNELLLDFQTS